MFEYALPLNPDFQGSTMIRCGLIRKGENGDRNVYFTERRKRRMAQD
jgi:hypothetical protein